MARRRSQDAPVTRILEKHGLPFPESARLFSGSLASVEINSVNLDTRGLLRLWSTARSLFDFANSLISSADR